MSNTYINLFNKSNNNTSIYSAIKQNENFTFGKQTDKEPKRVAYTKKLDINSQQFPSTESVQILKEGLGDFSRPVEFPIEQ
jgi:hypothetical protein